MSLDEDGNVYISANEGNLSVTFHGKLRSRIRGIFFIFLWIVKEVFWNIVNCRIGTKSN